MNKGGAKCKLVKLVEEQEKGAAIMTLRGFLYSLGRVLGDANAIGKGRIGRRIGRRAAGKVTGRLFRKLFK